MTQTLPRSGLVVPQEDRSDGFHPNLFFRNIGAWIEQNAVMYRQGLLADRPAAGKAGRLYRPTDFGLARVVYIDSGSTWEQIGVSAAADPSPSTPGLRTLGSGAQQAAPGDHNHGEHVYASTGTYLTDAGTVYDTDLTFTLPTGKHVITGAIFLTASSGTKIDLQIHSSDASLFTGLIMSIVGNTGSSANTCPVNFSAPAGDPTTVFTFTVNSGQICCIPHLYFEVTADMVITLQASYSTGGTYGQVLAGSHLRVHQVG